MVGWRITTESWDHASALYPRDEIQGRKGKPGINIVARPFDRFAAMVGNPSPSPSLRGRGFREEAAMRFFAWPLACQWLLLVTATTTTLSSRPAAAISPDDPGPGDVRFTVNSSTAKPISPYIYGMNFFAGSSLTNPVTIDRLGGNRWTGYNWETNASNAGADWYHHSDYYLTGGAANRPPGDAVRPSLVAAANNHRALVVTVPIAGYVSADANGTVDETQAAPSSRWREVRARKSSVYPDALSLNPNKTDAYVFTDEFVNWVEQTRQPNQTVFYSLDNEPGLWGEPLPPDWQSGDPPGGTVVQPSSGGRTHPLIHPYAPTFTEMRDKTIAHASAIKSVNPNAIVFGGVGYGWNEFTTLQDSPGRVTTPSHPGGDQTGELHYYEWLLQQVAAAEATQGRTLMDVLDLHWYPEAQDGGMRITGNDNSAAVIAARVQAPRSLWDPTYTETSWISQWSTWVGSPGNPGPVKLLPRVQRDINDFKPGTKIAITEYNYGGTNHISGGIAQADVLGIFGREGLFAATFWSLHGDANSQFASGAFKMYLDYDGANGEGRFGDVSIDAATTSNSQSAVYASLDSDDPNRMVVVAINRTNAAKDAAIAVTHDRRFDIAEVYQLTSASSSPFRAADAPIDLVNAFIYEMPAYSVSTLVLRPAIDGDYNVDGGVDGADLAAWSAGFGATGGASLRDGDGADFLTWQRALGNSSSAAAGQTPVPEPRAMALLVAAALAVLRRCLRR